MRESGRQGAGLFSTGSVCFINIPQVGSHCQTLIGGVSGSIAISEVSGTVSAPQVCARWRGNADGVTWGLTAGRVVLVGFSCYTVGHHLCDMASMVTDTRDGVFLNGENVSRFLLC